MIISVWIVNEKQAAATEKFSQVYQMLSKIIGFDWSVPRSPNETSKAQ